MCAYFSGPSDEEAGKWEYYRPDYSKTLPASSSSSLPSTRTSTVVKMMEPYGAVHLHPNYALACQVSQVTCFFVVFSCWTNAFHVCPAATLGDRFAAWPASRATFAVRRWQRNTKSSKLSGKLVRNKTFKPNITLRTGQRKLTRFQSVCCDVQSHQVFEQSWQPNRDFARTVQSKRLL